MAKNWHDALWRLFPAELLGKGEEPAGGKANVLLRVDYYDGKSQRRLDRDRPRRRAAAAHVGRGAAPPGEMYARTEHTAGWAKLPRAASSSPTRRSSIAAP